MTPLLVMALAGMGAIGSALRYLTDNALPARVRRRFPWGTAAVNLTGSLALGAITGAATGGLPEVWSTILGTGLIGGYTTFSAASLETIRLMHDRRQWAAAVYGLGTLAGCVALAAIGLVAFGP